MGGRNRWEKMVLRDGKQFNVKCKFVPALVELDITLTDHTGRVLGTAKVCRHFYFTFEIFKEKKRTGKRRLADYSESHLPKEYGSAVARWLISKHIPRYTD